MDRFKTKTNEVDIVHSLCVLPATDGNFKAVLQRANLEQIGRAIYQMEQKIEGNKTKIFACKTEIKKRRRGIKA